MFYLFAFILSYFCWFKLWWEHIWFIPWKTLGDILDWIRSPCYFPTRESLLWSCFLSSGKLHHHLIPCMLTHVIIKTSPKLWDMWEYSISSHLLCSWFIVFMYSCICYNVATDHFLLDLILASLTACPNSSVRLILLYWVKN